MLIFTWLWNIQFCTAQESLFKNSTQLYGAVCDYNIKSIYWEWVLKHNPNFRFSCAIYDVSTYRGIPDREKTTTYSSEVLVLEAKKSRHSKHLTVTVSVINLNFGLYDDSFPISSIVSIHRSSSYKQDPNLGQ